MREHISLRGHQGVRRAQVLDYTLAKRFFHRWSPISKSQTAAFRVTGCSVTCCTGTGDSRACTPVPEELELGVATPNAAPR